MQELPFPSGSTEMQEELEKNRELSLGHSGPLSGPLSRRLPYFRYNFYVIYFILTLFSFSFHVEGKVKGGGQR